MEWQTKGKGKSRCIVTNVENLLQQFIHCERIAVIYLNLLVARGLWSLRMRDGGVCTEVGQSVTVASSDGVDMGLVKSALDTAEPFSVVSTRFYVILSEFTELERGVSHAGEISETWSAIPGPHQFQ